MADETITSTSHPKNGNDPSRNVLDLVEAGNQRQDDLRVSEGLHVREIINLRAEEQSSETAAMQYVERLRADHATELRIAEAERINAIRAVDVQAVQQAAQVQDTRATALAAQVAASAEAMRSQVAATTSAAATALATALAPITTSIEQLRQAMYEAQGQKTQVVETRAKGASMGMWWGVVLAGGMAFLTVLVVILMAISVAAVATHGFTK
jgi:hypothetical protein